MKWKCFLAFLFLLFNIKDTGAQMNAFRESGTIELEVGRNITELFMIDDVLYVLAYDSEYEELPPCIDPCKDSPCPPDHFCYYGTCSETQIPRDTPKNCSDGNGGSIREEDLIPIDYRDTSFLIKITGVQNGGSGKQERLELAGTHIRLLGVDPTEYPGSCTDGNCETTRYAYFAYSGPSQPEPVMIDLTNFNNPPIGGFFPGGNIQLDRPIGAFVPGQRFWYSASTMDDTIFAGALHDGVLGGLYNTYTLCSDCTLEAICADPLERFIYLATTSDEGRTSQIRFYNYLVPSEGVPDIELQRFRPGRMGPSENELVEADPLPLHEGDAKITSCFVSREEGSVFFTTERARIIRIGLNDHPDRARIQQYSILVPATLYNRTRMLSGHVDKARGHAYFGMDSDPHGHVIDLNLKTMEISELFSAQRSSGFISSVFDEKNRAIYFGTRTKSIARVLIPASCPNNCNDQGTCERGVCTCDPPFDGVDCSNQECPNGCSGHGTCFQGICECTPPYVGDDCSLGGCPNDCSGHGRCDNSTYICYCEALWGGDDCSENFLPQVPGSLDFLGFGFDLRYLDDQFVAVKQNMIGFTSLENRTYNYPGQPEVRWVIPDQVRTLTTSSSSIDTYFFDDLDSLYLQYYLGLGVTIPYLSVGVYFENRIFKEGTSTKITTEGLDTLYNLVLIDRPLSDEIKAFLETADTLTSFGELNAWGHSFIDTFGTHYVDQVTMGGKIKIDAITESKTLGIGFTLGATLGTNYGSISLSLGVEFSTDFLNAVKSTTMNTVVDGGEPEIGSALIAPSPSNARQLVASWQQTVVKNPVPISWTLREIYYLIPDSGKRWYICRALEVTLNIPIDKRRCV